MNPSERRHYSLQGVVEDMPTALVLVEVPSGTVLYANAAARRHPYVFVPEPVDTFDERGEPLPAEARPHAVAAAGTPFDHVVREFRTRGHDGAWLLFHSHVMDRGRIAVLTFEDVTALHQAQAQLREALVARDELVSMASHELRSPIGALALAVEQIERKARTAGLDDVLRLTSLGARQVHRLKVLVGNMLDVSRLRAGRFELDRERGRLADVVSDACVPLHDQAAAQRTAFECHIDTDGEGCWDVVRMDQVVTNLVANALKYGGGKPVRVWLEAAGDAHVELSVEDEGPGIPREQQARIFEPFERASPRYRAQSLGLGLYIVREIVTAHGGTVALASEPGHTRFTIRLPL